MIKLSKLTPEEIRKSLPDKPRENIGRSITFTQDELELTMRQIFLAIGMLLQAQIDKIKRDNPNEQFEEESD